MVLSVQRVVSEIVCPVGAWFSGSSGGPVFLRVHAHEYARARAHMCTCTHMMHTHTHTHTHTHARATLTLTLTLSRARSRLAACTRPLGILAPALPWPANLLGFHEQPRSQETPSRSQGCARPPPGHGRSLP